MKSLIVIASALALAGCGAQQSKATVSAAEASLAAAGKVALGYLALPVCGPGAPQVCSEEAIRAKIKQTFDAADDAVVQAQATADAGGNPDMTAATAALQSLQSLLNAYAPKPGKGA